MTGGVDLPGSEAGRNRYGATAFSDPSATPDVLIVEYRLDTPTLRETLERTPGVRLRVEEVYSENREITVIFRTECNDWTAFETAVEEDPTVTTPELLTETAEGRLYQLRLTERGKAGTPYPEWSRLGIVLLEATGTSVGWELRLRVPDRDTLGEHNAVLRERDIGFRIRAIYSRTERGAPRRTNLTRKQRETLLSAYDAGYFDVPRRVSQSDLAAQLDISPQSLSERLRRGTATLVETTLR